MDVALMMLGMAALGKVVPKKEGLAWGMLGCGLVIALAMLWFLACGLLRY